MSDFWIGVLIGGSVVAVAASVIVYRLARMLADFSPFK